MEYCFFDKENPPKYDIDFYKSGIYEKSYAHIDNEVHNLRMEVAESLLRFFLKFNEIKRIIDVGSGDGGFLQSITANDSIREYEGYELCRKNYEVSLGRLSDRANVKVNYIDFTTIKLQSDLAIITEVLEHLIDPRKLLSELDTKYVLASSPLDETPEKRIGRGVEMVHLWGWDEEGFKKVFTDTGYDILVYATCAGTIQGKHQFVIAKKI